jgi:hypothetical protein
VAIICPTCGADNDDWRPFCTRCSQSLAGAQQRRAALAAAVPAPAAAASPGASGPPGTQPAAGPGSYPGAAPPPPPPLAAPPTPWLAPTGAPAPVPLSTSPPRRSSSSSYRSAVAVPLVIVLAVAAGLGVVRWRSDQHHWPARWDARVQPIVDFVERTRGLTFEHPVEVKFVPEAAFKKLVTSDTPLSASERRDAAREVAMLRALGLAQGDVDLQKAENDLQGGTVEAFYRDSDKRVYVRGAQNETLDVSARVTLAHELTHALDDQHFDLAAVRRYGDQRKTDAVTALVEGDAVTVQDAYEASLSAADQRAYDRQQQDFGNDANIASVPDALVINEEWPYDFGPTFVDVLRSVVNGADRLDSAFVHPPQDEEQVLDPTVFLAGTRPVVVPTPALPKTATDVNQMGEFGAVGWLLMLGEHGDAHAALRVVDGWAGDNLTTYTDGGRTCAAIGWAGKTPAATAQLASMLAGWRKAVPLTGATWTVSGARLALKTCDPGPLVRVVTHRGKDAYQLAVFRAEIVQGAAEDVLKTHGQLRAATVWCAANRVIDASSLAQLNAADAGNPAESRALTDRARAAGVSCAAAG